MNQWGDLFGIAEEMGMENPFRSQNNNENSMVASEQKI